MEPTTHDLFIHQGHSPYASHCKSRARHQRPAVRACCRRIGLAVSLALFLLFADFALPGRAWSERR